MSMDRLRSNLALILFGAILGVLGYKGVTSLTSSRAPVVVAEDPKPGGGGPVKWENPAVVALTQMLPSAPGKATNTDGVTFAGGVYQPKTAGGRARIRVTAYASSAEPNEAVIAVFRAGSAEPLAVASKPTSGNKRETIELRVDVPSVAGQLNLECRVGPGRPGTIVFNGPQGAPERAVTVVQVTE